jgi:CMP-N-acetylneuraminic acid synthetase
VTRVVLSTESRELAEEGSRRGAEVPFLRPEALARDDSSSLDVIWHALATLGAGGYAPDCLLLLQPTSPFRNPADIDKAFDRLSQMPDGGAVISVSEAKPPFWTQALRADGRLRVLGGNELAPSLGAGERYAMANGIYYLARVDYLKAHQGFEGPHTFGHLTDPLLSIDIDTQADLEAARRLADAGLAPALPGEEPLR